MISLDYSFVEGGKKIYKIICEDGELKLYYFERGLCINGEAMITPIDTTKAVKKWIDEEIVRMHQLRDNAKLMENKLKKVKKQLEGL